VVKNGSKTCSRTCSSMPTPVSETASSTCGPGAPSPCVRPALVELDVRGLDRQRAAVGHRVAGVGGEVEDHALDLRAVGLDRREVGRERDADADVVADDPVQHRLHAGDDLVEVEHRGCSTWRRLNASSWRVSAAACAAARAISASSSPPSRRARISA
jgi:hypothetical protein